PNQLARTVTLTQVLKNQVRPEIFKDKLVIIGTIATSVHPGFYTPYSADPKQPARMPAVLIHTQIASQLLSSVLDGRSLITYWSNESETMWILLWSLIGGVITWLFGHSRILSLVVGILMASLVVICNVLFFQAVWVPLIPPALAFVISCFSVLSTSYLIILRLRRG
nr:CHASE2 domain-containing protein [Calothrix sp. MO_167.B42]